MINSTTSVGGITQLYQYAFRLKLPLNIVVRFSPLRFGRKSFLEETSSKRASSRSKGRISVRNVNEKILVPCW